jgi:predicted CoA-binding protein
MIHVDCIVLTGFVSFVWLQLEMENDDVIEVYQEQTGGCF